MGRASVMSAYSVAFFALEEIFPQLIASSSVHPDRPPH